MSLLGEARSPVAKKKVRSLPRLAHARLYLDDIVEIEEYVRAAYAAKFPDRPGLSFQYSVGGGDIFTEIEELRAHSGFTSFFQLLMVRKPDSNNGADTILCFYSIIRPSLSIPYELKQCEWELTSKIGQVFDGRRDKLREFGERFPSWTGFATGAFVGFALFRIYEFALDLRVHKPYSGDLRVASLLALASCGCFAVGFVSVLRKSGVYLWMSRERHLTQLAKMQGVLTKFAWLVTGGFIEWLFQKLK